MCGINSMILYPQKRTQTEKKLVSHIFTEALVNTEARGEDATGVALVRIDGSVEILKAALPASEFVETKEYRKFLERVEAVRGGVVLGHTRFATQGDFHIMRNNHPFHVGNVVGVHNGVVYNYYEKVPFYDVESECDSEVIFHALARRARKSSLSKRAIQTALRPFEGDFALAFCDVRRPGLHLVRQNNPLELMDFQGLGVTMANSRSDYMRNGLHGVLRAISMWIGKDYSVGKITRRTLNSGDYLFLGVNGKESRGRVKIPSGLRYNHFVGSSYATRGGAKKGLPAPFDLEGAVPDTEYCHDCFEPVTSQEVKVSFELLGYGPVLCSNCLALEFEEIFGEGPHEGRAKGTRKAATG